LPKISKICFEDIASKIGVIFGIQIYHNRLMCYIIVFLRHGCG